MFFTLGSTTLLAAALISTSAHAATAEELIVQAQATDLMNALIRADVTSVKPPLVPEFVQAQKEGAEILKTW